MATTTQPRRVWPGRLLHVLALLLIGPWLVYFATSVLTGSVGIEPGVIGIIFTYASALGLSLISLVPSVAVALFRPLFGWIVFAVLGGVSVIGVAYSENKAAGKDTSAAIEDTVPSKIEVTVAAEILPPEKRDANVTPEVIAAMNDHVLNDFKQRYSRRAGAKHGDDPNVTVGTLRLEQDGHDLYMTELRPKQPASGQKPVLRMLWNIHDGQLKRVFCAYEQDDPTWRATRCGQQVSKTFTWDGWYTPRK
ncbi:ABC transporter permease [Pseudoxanthomonas sp. SL93]|uniref:ABC transporter permease n=1 Tax=Pseudoxanthomonas sp. SL93 TaxID=2995142 RepID=UPI00226EA7C2|nr:ABC transporter permease [Pseudoxanthomonas sp. SL93]WAC63651.1 ABC transporter permease [Pseudoxanthomonas sp. SL93]